MKFEEFKKYRALSESGNLDLCNMNDESRSIHSWLEDHRLLNEAEGIWSSIWGWLKKNFSPTALKLNKLADEFEEELEAEYKAEYGKLKDKKDIASKMRSSYAGKLSVDIEERMNIIAGDDPVYRELVRHLLNKKTLAVKRRVVDQYKDILADEYDDLSDKFDKEIKDEDKEGEKILQKIALQNKQIFQKLLKKIDQNRKEFEFLMKSQKDKENFVKIILAYTKRVSEMRKGDFNSDELYTNALEYSKIIKELVSKIKGSTSTQDEAESISRKALNELMMREKPLEISKLRDEALKNAKVAAGSGKESAKEEGDALDSKGVVTPETGEVLTKDEIEKAVDNAKEETGKESPTKVDIAKEINSHVKDYFQTNKEEILDDLNLKIKKFNKKTAEERGQESEEFEYVLEDGKLPDAKEDDLEKIAEDFTDIMGSIVPYYQTKDKPMKEARRAVSRFLFEIFAVKKNPAGRLRDADRNRIIDVIKSKYS